MPADPSCASASGTVRALLIDGLNLVRRIHAGVPGDGGAAHDGDVLLAVGRSLERALEQSAATHAVCVFDAPGPSWRHDLLPEYKAGRRPMPETLAALMPRIEATIAERDVRCVRVPGFEADDVLASIAVRIAGRGGEVVILSTDKSMLMLLGPQVRVRNHFEQRDLDAAWCRERYGVAPGQLATWLALVGERSQGVPGVKSIGARTAAALIAEHDTLEAILAAAPQMENRAGRALLAEADNARLSLALTTLRTDVEAGVNLKSCRVAPRAVEPP